MKKIIIESDKEGFPFTAMREIQILKRVNHENIIKLTEVVTSQGEKIKISDRGNTYLIFEYCKYDLTGLLEVHRKLLPQSILKGFLKQLLAGVNYLHDNKLAHRDLKSSNLLITSQGILKIADFGLARVIDHRYLEQYTRQVITLWYRPPELILGEKTYGFEIDMWSVGCIIVEVLVGSPIFAANKESELMNQIWDKLGGPNEHLENQWKNLRD